MRRLWVFFAWLPAFAAGTLPNRYIVELAAQPVAQHVSDRRLLHSAEAERQRALVRAQQAAVSALVQRAHGRVRGAVENIADALFVEIPDSEAAQLANIPGVARVLPVRMFHLLLDHALVLHNVPQAWSQVGYTNAGAGIRIGMIDTGIDIGHPGFNDAGFTAPAGFPVADSQADLAYTNNKVIVARSYAALFASPDPDPSAADHMGHGTATAMAAAGVTNAGPLATITGVAPQAYLGSYKVFGTPGFNDGASEDAILAALEDALTDGMDIVSLSLGSDLAGLPQGDPEVQALHVLAAAGVIPVVAAGNNGSDPNTIASPGTAPDAITVGASNNDRFFAASAQVQGGNSLIAVPGDGANSPSPITAPLADVSALDGNGLACGAFPANSLAGAIAFIFRGTCTFESKLDNVQAAGAVGALVYDNVATESPVMMAVGAATLPAEMISDQDGLNIKGALSAGQTATLNFALGPFYTNPASLAAFSAAGPNVDFSIKPDLVAVGENMYTAAERLDPTGDIYNATGYAVEQGTSFSTPLVAGAAAVLKQFRPGLTVAQYRSLLIDSAAPASVVPGTAARVQQAGGGVLDVLTAINDEAALAPVSLSFGHGGSSINAVQPLIITNAATVADTFQVAVAPRDSSGPAPILSTASVQLAPGASAPVYVVFQAAGMVPGQYEGNITVQGAHSGVVSHAAYWYAVDSQAPAHITTLYNAGSTAPEPAGSRLDGAVVFRISDASGVPLPGAAPVVTAATAGARVVGISSMDSIVPGAFSLSVRLSSTPGANAFQIQAGSITVQVTITGQ